MKAPLRIALTLFSYEALQTWAILICGVLMGLGILLQVFGMAAFFATVVLLGPIYGGGMVLRMASSPTVLHLRPHGRRRMLLGATGTITLVALVWTLPVLLFQLTGSRIPDGSSEFNLPAPETFLICWGFTALLWVWTFFASRIQLLLAFSWIPLGAAFFVIDTLHLPAAQLTTALFVAGAIGWAGFAVWYLKTPSVMRPDWMAAWSRGQAPLDFGQLLAGLRAGGSKPGEAEVSRPVALRQYLTGTNSILTPLLMGTVFALLWTVAYSLLDRSDGSVPVDFLMFLPLLSASFSLVLVRRARLAWLRVGLDRAGLFAAVERHALRASLVMFSVPIVVLVTLSLVRKPGLAAGILLFAATQVIANACFLQASLAVTRGWNWGTVLKFIGLGLLFMVMSIILQPHRGAFVWTYIATLVVFGGLALFLRHRALRAWQALDWRVAGPLPAGVGRQRN